MMTNSPTPQRLYLMQMRIARTDRTRRVGDDYGLLSRRDERWEAYSH